MGQRNKYRVSVEFEVEINHDDISEVQEIALKRIIENLGGRNTPEFNTSEIISSVSIYKEDI